MRSAGPSPHPVIRPVPEPATLQRAGVLAHLGPPAADFLGFATLVAVPLAVSPRFWDPFTHVKWYVLETLVVTWWLVELLLCRSRGWPLFVKRRAAACAALAALVLDGGLRSGLEWAVAPVLDRVCFVVLALCWFWSFRRNARRTGLVTMALGLAAALVDVVGLAQLAGWRPLPWLAAGDQRSAFFGNVNMTGQFLGFAVVVLACAPGRGRDRRWGRAAAVTRAALVGLSLVYLVLLSCRSVLLGLAAALVVHAAARWKSAGAAWRLASTGALAALLLVGVGRVATLDAAEQARKSESLAQRLAVWEATLRMIADHPMGVGSGNFATAFPPYLSAGRLAPSESLVFLSPHNESLRALAEEGVLFCAVAALLLVSLLRQLHRSPRIDRWRSGAGALLGPAFALYAVEAFFQFPLATAAGSLMAAVLLGLALACLEEPAPGMPEGGEGRRASARAWVLVGVPAAALALWALGRVVSSEYLFVNERDDLAAQDSACRLNPRHTPPCVTAAWLESQAGAHASARARLARVLRRAPYDGPAIKLLGEVALAQGDREAGCFYLWVYDELFRRRAVHEQAGQLCDPATFDSFAARTRVPYGPRFPLVSSDAAPR